MKMIKDRPRVDFKETDKSYIRTTAVEYCEAHYPKTCTEFKRIQKKRPVLINQFIFPAISTLYLPDAQNGFTYNNNSSWKLKDNNFLY